MGDERPAVNLVGRDEFERMFEALQLRVDRTGSLVDATIARAHQDAAGGKGGPKATTWVVHVVDSRRKSTPSSTARDVWPTNSAERRCPFP